MCRALVLQGKVRVTCMQILDALARISRGLPSQQVTYYYRSSHDVGLDMNEDICSLLGHLLDSYHAKEVARRAENAVQG